jgi:hypothetical protein
MRASSLLPLALCACNQVLGIDDGELDDVPAIVGDYVVGVDFRTNATLDTVVVLAGRVEYDRDAQLADLTLTPLTATDHVNVGTPWVFQVTVTSSGQSTFAGDPVIGDVPTDANAKGMPFAIAGSIAGVFKDESTFCAVITGTFTTTDPAAPTSLPSVTLGAVKNASLAAPVVVSCDGDVFTP